MAVSASLPVASTPSPRRVTVVRRKHAAHYKRRFAPSVQILADEKRATYPLAGAIRGGAAELASPSVILKGLSRSAKNRTVQGRPIGDVRQLGGTLLVMPDGTI